MTLERLRPVPALRPTGGGFFDDPPSDDPAAGVARVVAGVYAQDMPVAGMTVGEIRARHGQRLDVPPGAVGYIGGAPVGDDTVVRAGQSLSFIRHSGSKGARAPVGLTDDLVARFAALRNALPDDSPTGLGRPAREPLRAPAREPVRETAAEDCSLRITDDRVEVRTPEGVADVLPLEAFLELLANDLPCGRDIVWPPGVRAILRQQGGATFVHETPPRVVPLRWIAADSPTRSGTGARYRIVSVSVPWTLVLCVFRRAHDGSLLLSGSSECFFRHERLRSVDDPLLFPALLNCSRSADPRDTRRSWICTQNMGHAELARVADPARRVSRSIEALVEHLWESGFNYSPEASGMRSWFVATIEAQVHPRLTSIESWAEASAEDADFALKVPWLLARQTLRQAAERLGGVGPMSLDGLGSARDLARLVLNRVRP
jgi:hypothetical protein